MAPKQKLDKEAWQWAEETEPENVSREHVETAYRIRVKPCREGMCRRNCKGSPNCLLGLGERDWLGDIDDKNWHDIDDPSTEKRSKGSYVGLKNLGATCYVNTFLQVWYHNPVFRTAILRYWHEPRKATTTPTEAHTGNQEESGGFSPVQAVGSPAAEASVQLQVKPADEDAEGQLMPATVCGHLQLVFALLQFSRRRYIDPTHFISSLQLDTGQQQDAQEFSKLFICLLEDTLRLHGHPQVSSLVQDQFMGLYNYVTVCSKCACQSRRESSFYELDLNIKGHKELRECIGEFLQEEKLEGDNQYMCAQCQSKQNATRNIQLKSLPPVLNLQLLRFVFERQTGHKKKLNTYIQFPEVLDMSSYLGKPEGEMIYDLTSVLIHRGPSAYSGHYIAHIKDKQTQTWYKFNDEDIEKMGGKNLQLGSEEEVGGENLQLGSEEEVGDKSSGKKPKSVKGYHASRNAYMLVYTLRVADEERQESLPELQLPDLPVQVQRLVDQDNQRLDSWVKEMDKMREENICIGKERQAEIKEIYSLLPPHKGDDREFIRTKWLTSWLSAESADKVSPIDHADLLCCHQRLNPDRVADVKCISSEAAEFLYSKYGGTPRLKCDDALCRDCIVERCTVIRTRARISEDSRLIASMLKVKNQLIDPEDSYWVGKASLRSWKRLAVERFEEQLQRSGLKVNAAGEVLQRSGLKVDASAEEREQKPEVEVKAAADEQPGSGLKVEAAVAELQGSEVRAGHTAEELQRSRVKVDAVSEAHCDGSSADPTLENSSKCEAPAACHQVGACQMSPKGAKEAGLATGCRGNLCSDSSSTLPQPDTAAQECKETTTSSTTVGSESSPAALGIQVIENSTEETTASTSPGAISPSTAPVSRGSRRLRESDEPCSAKSDQNLLPLENAARIQQMEEDEEEEDDGLSFNEDILCDDHGKLTTEEGCRRLVPGDIWSRLKSHFPTAPEFAGVAEACGECRASKEEERQSQELNKAIAAEQKAVLADLYLERHRPVWTKDIPQLCIVGRDFLDEWRAFIREPGRREPVSVISNKTLLCPHQGFLYPPETVGLDEESSKRLAYLRPEEWDILKTFMSIDIDITVTRIEEESNHVTFLVTPDVCEACCEARMEQEKQCRLNYSSAVLYIRKLTDHNSLLLGAESTAAGTQWSGVAGSEEDAEPQPQPKLALTNSEESNGHGSRDDPEFTEKINGKSKKRKRDMDGPSEKAAKIDPGQIRRSARRKRSRGEKDVVVSSTDTLRDLKLQIMKMFSVAPFDQHLLLDGLELTGDKQTLSQLGVLPEAIILLKVDEPMDDPTFYDDADKASIQEEGFKGTGLLGR